MKKKVRKEKVDAVKGQQFFDYTGIEVMPVDKGVAALRRLLKDLKEK